MVVKKQSQHKHSKSPTTHAMSEDEKMNLLTDLSPYTLCLFRLGLAPGVCSLLRAASSIPLRALLNAIGSTGSDPARSTPFVLWPFIRFRLLITMGGVLAAECETKVGVCELSTVLVVTEDVICDSIVVSRIAALSRLDVLRDFRVKYSWIWSLLGIFTGKQHSGEWPLDILCCVIADSHGLESLDF